jgi:predicted MFS family arabinose efflux permease
MSPEERRAAFSLASIFSFRMLGLFMILPVFALYAETLGDINPVLIGLAIGIYGLTQALLAIPYGLWSDRIGRKPVIAIGLGVFALGSVVAATADTITGIIAGRALQGSGAIAAAVMALAADLTREQHRTRAMAMIGMSIGLSFALALALGPVLNHWIGVPGIFWLTAALALVGIGMLYLVVPDPGRIRPHRDTGAVPGFFADVLRDPQLLRLDAGVFVLHCVLTASFIALPFALRDFAGLDAARHGLVYLPVLLASLVLMMPLVIVAEKHRRLKEVFLAAILILAAAEAGLILLSASLAGIVLMLLLFFIAFNVLEALLPSLLAKFAPADHKGTAMGVFSSCQFLGAFAGGIAGGAMYGGFGLSGTFGFCLFCLLGWALWARTMAPPPYLSSYMISMENFDASEAGARERELLTVPGVAEAVIVVDEAVAYLKVDSRTVDYDRIESVVGAWRTAGR